MSSFMNIHAHTVQYAMISNILPHTHTHTALRINVADKVREALTASDLDQT